MPRYKSITGRDVILRFHNTIIKIPAHGYYESTAEDLAALFPKHIEKLPPDAILQEIEPVLPTLRIEQSPIPKITPISIVTNQTNCPPTTPVTLDIPIAETTLPALSSMQIDFQNIPLQIDKNIPIIGIAAANPPPICEPETINITAEIGPPPIKSASVKKSIHKKTPKTINTGMDTKGDPDIKEFLEMIEEILSDK